MSDDDDNLRRQACELAQLVGLMQLMTLRELNWQPEHNALVKT
jgi:hypothetical protein